MGLAILEKHPTIVERDLHHCHCCSPPRRTLVYEVAVGMGAGYPQFTCPHTKISMRYSEGAETYLAGHVILPGDVHYNEGSLSNLWAHWKARSRGFVRSLRGDAPGPDSSYPARVAARRSLN
jgi:hypothetical protein